MNEPELTVSAREEDHTPPPADQTQVLSPRRRTALVTYLAILFAIAFLFVAVVMVLETKRLKTMNEELQDTNQKTSASLTNNINALQEENQTLSKDNEDLQARVAELEAEAEKAQAEQNQLQSRIVSLTNARQTLSGKKRELEAQVRMLTKQAEDAVTVSELLQKAVAADEAGDMDGLQALLEQIEPMEDLLSPSEKEIYESVVID